MKRLVLLFSCLLLIGCGEKKETDDRAETDVGSVIENSTEQSEGVTSATASGNDISDLPTLPEEITKEFIMGLWAKPHDDRGIIKELANVRVCEGVWKVVVITTGPDEKEMLNTSEATMTVKMVDRRFQVWQYSDSQNIEYSFVTYDYNAKRYRWWGVLADGFIMEWSGQRYLRDLLEWETVKVHQGIRMTVRETLSTEDRRKLKMAGEIKRDDEVVAYRKDELTWLSELPEEHRLPEVK
jgi:hypothetical protein